ncbi:hypothetical protein ScPMuIL_007323, partial [Solemya velum]
NDAQSKYIELIKSLTEAEGGETAGEVSEGSGRYNTLQVDQVDGVYKITLNRPNKKNAITLEMYEELCAGDYYCSGNDLGNFANIPPEGITAMAEKAGEILLKFVGTFIEFPKPLIGLINGPAVGVSVTILGLFDVVYASQAFRGMMCTPLNTSESPEFVSEATFHTPFSALGQSPEGCSSYTFPKMMGLAKASEMLLLNKKITAVEACERSLVTAVFPEDSFHKVTEQRSRPMPSYQGRVCRNPNA